MKYSQFLQLENKLLDENITIDDIKENHEILNEEDQVLNEIGLGAIGAIAGGVIAGLAALFHRRLIRWGISKVYLVKLRKIKSKFLKQVLESTSKYAQKTTKIRQELVAKEKELKSNPSEEAKAELAEVQQRKRQYDRRISQKVFDFIEKISAMKTKQIHEKIEEIKKLKPSQKYGLKVYWEQLKLEIEIEAFNSLVKNGVITDPEVIKEMEAEFSTRKDDVKDQLKDVGKKVKEEEQNKEIKETEIQYSDISQNIDELFAEKDKYDTEKLKKRIILIIRDIKKLDEKDDRNELYRKLSDKFGIDLLKEIKNELGGEIPSKRPQQTALKTDEL